MLLQESQRVFQNLLLFLSSDCMLKRQFIKRYIFWTLFGVIVVNFSSILNVALYTLMRQLSIK